MSEDSDTSTGYQIVRSTYTDGDEVPPPERAEVVHTDRNGDKIDMWFRVPVDSEGSPVTVSEPDTRRPHF
jgi:hypothetical protein